MDPLLLGGVVNTGATVFAGLGFAWLFVIHRQRELVHWARGWFWSAVGIALGNYEARHGSSLLTSLGAPMIALAGMEMLRGVYVLRQRPLPRGWWVALGVMAAFSFAAGVAGADIKLAIAGPLLFGVSTQFGIGVVLLRARRGGTGAWVGGVGHLLLAMHALTYPLVMDDVFALTRGYLIASALALLAAGGLVLLHYENTLESLRESQRRERAQSRLETVGRLAGGVAHDFNNLLTVIRGEASMLEADETIEPNVRSAVAAIGDAAKQASRLTRQLLTFGRGSDLERRAEGTSELFESSVRVLRKLIPKDVEVVLEPPPQATVLINRAAFEQVLANVVANACAAMPGGGTLTIGCGLVTAATKRGTVLWIEVRDTGIGMDDETRERMFDPFFTTREVGGGTGLGLATVHGIVRQYDGFIDVESKPGQGTRIRASLRLATATPMPEASSTTRDEPPCPLNVLLAEDDPAVRRYVARVLAREGHDVTEASDGAQALEHVVRLHGEGRVDVIVSDVMMPGLTGIELAGELRSRSIDVPIVLVTGQPSSAELQKLPSRTSLVPKPFSAEDLLDAIARRHADE